MGFLCGGTVNSPSELGNLKAVYVAIVGLVPRALRSRFTMRHPIVQLPFYKSLGLLTTAAVAAAVMIAALVYLTGHGRTTKAAEASAANPSNVASETVQLADSQLGAIN